MSAVCGNCKKPLTDPESVKRGLGSDCWAKMSVRMELEKDTRFTHFEGDLVVRRNASGVKYISIPHMIECHSPSGFEWGYPGSGPAELALNTLFFFTKDCGFSFKYHQSFKSDFIEGIPQAGGRVPGDRIKAWIEEKRAWALAQGELFGEREV